jgi:hypothetical protein
MPQIITFFLSGIFTCLACLHFYWAWGGKTGFLAALPDKPNGEKLFLPTSFDCVVVGLSLLVFGVLVWVSLPTFWKKLGLGGLAVVFALRAVGEFHYVGFFKSVTHTPFAKLDTWYYSPLCAVVSLMLVYLWFQTKKIL